MTASASAVLVHRSVTFTTTVTNLGPHDAAGVQLEDDQVPELIDLFDFLLSSSDPLVVEKRQ